VGAAAALAACALFVQARTRRAQRAFPPQGRFVDVSGVRLHYTEHGEPGAGPCVVLLHGDGSMGEELERSTLPAQLAAHHRVLVFDRPGYGHSERPPGRHPGPQEQAELLHAALARLGAGRAIVLGHSWGALVALSLGLRHPDSVAGLVLASGYYFPTVRMDVAWLSGPAWPLVGPLVRHTIGPLVGRALWWPMLRRMFAPAPVSPSFEGYPLWLALRPSQLHSAAAESASLIPATLALRREYAGLRVPAVVIAGADDRYVHSRWHSARLHERLERSWLRMVEGAGHMVHHTAPGQVLAAVEQVAAMGRAPTLVPLATEGGGATAHALGARAAEPGAAVRLASP
jgi:pimeloyl-ACP methyl ester carboxylesterase